MMTGCLPHPYSLPLFPRPNPHPVAAKHAAHVRELHERYQCVREGQQLLTIPFVSVSDYIFLLRAAALELHALGPRAMLYLAAAVSDFYIPASSMSEHKIQSRSGPLTMSLAPVPKMLHPLVRSWCPEAFTISFKLETDDKVC